MLPVGNIIYSKSVITYIKRVIFYSEPFRSLHGIFGYPLRIYIFPGFTRLAGGIIATELSSISRVISIGLYGNDSEGAGSIPQNRIITQADSSNFLIVSRLDSGIKVTTMTKNIVNRLRQKKINN